jgi:hypothetical protein
VKPTMKEGQALMMAIAEAQPALRLMIEIVHRNAPGARENLKALEALMNELEIYFDSDLPAAIEAVKSGAIASEVKSDGWRIFKT